MISRFQAVFCRAKSGGLARSLGPSGSPCYGEPEPQDAASPSDPNLLVLQTAYDSIVWKVQVPRIKFAFTFIHECCE